MYYCKETSRFKHWQTRQKGRTCRPEFLLWAHFLSLLSTWEERFWPNAAETDQELYMFRHSESEKRLIKDNSELNEQLKSCQKDLSDINEFLLNELKASLLSLDEMSMAEWTLTLKLEFGMPSSTHHQSHPALWEIFHELQVQALICAELEDKLEDAQNDAKQRASAQQVYSCLQQKIPVLSCKICIPIASLSRGCKTVRAQSCSDLEDSLSWAKFLFPSGQDLSVAVPMLINF